MTRGTHPGAHARWSAAALLAPTAAALFTGATAWTLHHSPAPTKQSATTPKPASAAAPSVSTRRVVDPAVARLRSSVRHDAAQLALLQRTLVSLRADVRKANSVTPAAGPSASAVQAQAGAPVNAPAPYAAAPAAPVYVAQAPAYVPPAQPVAPAPAPAPAPVVQQAPPPTHTTTGASGAPK